MQGKHREVFSSPEVGVVVVERRGQEVGKMGVWHRCGGHASDVPWSAVAGKVGFVASGSAVGLAPERKNAIARAPVHYTHAHERRER